jgi:NAD(P)H-hydrate epimerase
MARLLTRQIVRRWVPKRKTNAHKGDMGRVYIVAGSRGMAGAGVLSALGALRAGAGLTRLGTVSSQQKIVVNHGPLEVTTEGLPEGKDGLLSPAAGKFLEKALTRFQADVVAMGPGLGQSAAVRSVVKKFVRVWKKPLVLDADGLNAFAKTGAQLAKHGGPLIITPHAGELARLLAKPVSWINAHREEAARTAAKRFKCVCLLKGAGTLVTNGTVMWENPTGNPGMASGGMGDVLTGIIAAFAARVPPLQAACIGAYVHGLAGDMAAKKISKAGYVASELAGLIPQALGKI